MIENHKHKGMYRTNGSLRPHPINRTHKNPQVKRYHTMEINKPVSSKPVAKNKSILKNFFNKGKDEKVKNVSQNKKGVMVIKLKDLPSNVTGIYFEL